LPRATEAGVINAVLFQAHFRKEAIMAGSDRHVTTDHDEIRRWVEKRGGRPAAPGGSAGILRIDFPDHGDDSTLAEIPWEDRLLAVLIDVRERGRERHF
jgi:hypothetical protein